jgi:NADH dehydrogenase [ubiquinone] 1 alpha subcomplex assembly factor 5
LSRKPDQGTSIKMSDAPPQIFDDRRRMASRARSLTKGVEQSFLFERMADELAERLRFVTLEFQRVLLMGSIAALSDKILPASEAEIVALPMAAEDALDCGEAAFDLIISAGTLDSVNDLPGALVQIRRALRPSGLFLGTIFGAGSLPTLKSAMLEADGDRAAAHIHPQIDLRAISGLMQRAGFVDPVSDLDGFEVRYSDWRSLVADLRAAGAGNALTGSRRYLGRNFPSKLDAAWTKRAESDGKTKEFFNLLHLSGWAKP